MRKPNPPKLVTIAVTTTITIVFWIFFTLYQVLTTKPQPSVSETLMEPINPTLDTKSLDTLKDRVFFEEGSYTFNPQVTFAPAKPQPTETPTAENPTVTGEISPTPTTVPALPSP